MAILLNFRFFFLIDEISWKYWNLDWWISIEVIFAKVEFWYRKLRSLNCIKFTFWNFWRNFWGWMLKPLVIGSNSLCDFQENLFGIAVFCQIFLYAGIHGPKLIDPGAATGWSDFYTAVWSASIARTRTEKVLEILDRTGPRPWKIWTSRTRPRPSKIFNLVVRGSLLVSTLYSSGLEVPNEVLLTFKIFSYSCEFIIWLTCSRMEFWMINKFNFRNWIH